MRKQHRISIAVASPLSRAWTVIPWGGLSRIGLILVLLCCAPQMLLAQPPTPPDFEVALGESPAVTSQGDGDFVVLWSDSASKISVLRFDSNGFPVGSSFHADNAPAALQGRPDAAPLPSGDFVAGWEDGSVVNKGVHARRFDSNGFPVGASFQVDAAGSRPSIDRDDLGRFVVSWTAPKSAGGADHLVMRFDSNGFPVGAALTLGAAASETSRSSVAVQPDGDFVVVWKDLSESILAASFDSNGFPVGAAFQVNGAALANAAPDVATGLDGDFTVVWERVEQATGNRDVYSRRIGIGSPIGEELRISDMPSDQPTHPVVAADDTGKVMASWRCSNAAMNIEDVVSRRLDLFGAVIGDEFRISIDQGSAPAVAPAGPGSDFIDVWQERMPLGDCVAGRFVVVPEE